MSEKIDSNPLSQVPSSRPERRRRVHELMKQLLSRDERKMLVQEGLNALGQQSGVLSLMRLMEEDINEACGVQGKWEQNPGGRTGSRNGRGPGTAWIGSSLVHIERPRAVRAKGGEIPLPSYQAAQDPKFLTNAVLTPTVLGVSMRSYAPVAGAINPILPELPVSALSKSSIGRRFQAAMDSFLKTFLGRRLDERYLAVWVDAVAEGDYSVLAAVGLTADGTKKVLGLRQGSTETADLCSEFLEDLKARGLSAKRGLLWVVDGGTAMLSALREVFGKNVLIQRCVVHKRRNIVEKLTLPESEKKELQGKLEAAWALQDPAVAKIKLELLARDLESCGQEAAARSLREGLPETLTCSRLGVPPDLRASLTNTNPIESTFSVHEATAHRVKRWRNGKMVWRWVGASSYRAEKAFNRVGTPETLAQLSRALDRHVALTVVPSKPALSQPALSLAS